MSFSPTANRVIPLDADDPLIQQAAEIVGNAQALLVTAGAGMGVGSGLPEFRGPEGFWRAYPAYRRLGLSFARLADPRHFHEDPALAWRFYGHRLHLYRDTVPHAGFALLRRWGERMAGGYGVFTSNVDGQFQRAGFDPERITEVHGSIHRLQCLNGCRAGVWSAGGVQVDVDRANDVRPAAAAALPYLRGHSASQHPDVWRWSLGWTGYRHAGGAVVTVDQAVVHR